MSERMKVYRDRNGVAVHIGEWDYMPDKETGEPRMPVPDGVTVAEEDVTTRAGGGLVPAADYRRLRAEAYLSEMGPIGDQMDALYRQIEALGSQTDEMRGLLATRAGIKMRYSKGDG